MAQQLKKALKYRFAMKESLKAIPITVRSTSGYFFMVAGEPICFGAKTQIMTAQSTVETELTANLAWR